MPHDGDAPPPMDDPLPLFPTDAISELRRIGEGGSAVVYAATWHDRDVALKVAKSSAFDDERDKQRFLDEASRLARVEHAGVVEVLDTGMLEDGRPYLVMPLLEGESLADRIARERLPPAETIELFLQIADALGAIHDAGLLHRDLKPGNVFLLAPTSRAVLLDLGIAKDLDASASTLTQAGVIRGTPAIMAPERFFGTPASVSTDVYELGVVLYAMLVGRLPWENPTNVEARLFPRLPEELEIELPAALVDVMMSALSTRPERRPESAAAFARLVREANEREPPSRPFQTEAVLPSPPRMPSIDTPDAAASAAPGRSLAPTTKSRRAGWPWIVVGTIAASGLFVAFASRMTAAPTLLAPPAMTTSSSEPTIGDAAGIVVPADAAPGDAVVATTASTPAASVASAASALPSVGALLPLRSRQQALAWCNQNVDVVCDPELISINPRAQTACDRELAALRRLQRGPRSAWEQANKECRERNGSLRGIAQLEKRGETESTLAAIRGAASAAGSSYAGPAPDAQLDSWVARMPACQAYVAFFCSERVKALHGAFGCNAARNAVYVMAKNVARYGQDAVAGHNHSCQVMLDGDRAHFLGLTELTETLHPAGSASAGANQP